MRQAGGQDTLDVTVHALPLADAVTEMRFSYQFGGSTCQLIRSAVVVATSGETIEAQVSSPDNVEALTHLTRTLRAAIERARRANHA